jgi:hypothetical protein
LIVYVAAVVAPVVTGREGVDVERTRDFRQHPPANGRVSVWNVRLEVSRGVPVPGPRSCRRPGTPNTAGERTA